MKSNYEYIVLGCGGIGAAALYWLARRAGAAVLGLEQFALFHHNGGSQDHSRIIRLAYHRDDYARLAVHAYAAWATVEEESGVEVVTKTGEVLLAYQASEFHTKTCLYTMTPDRDFVLDRLPAYPQLSVVVGDGHAYKFASIMGKILSELALDGATRHDITPYSLQRPALAAPPPSTRKRL